MTNIKKSIRIKRRVNKVFYELREEDLNSYRDLVSIATKIISNIRELKKIQAAGSDDK